MTRRAGVVPGTGLALGLALAAPAAAQQLEFSGAITAQARGFLGAPVFAGQNPNLYQPSLAFDGRASLDWNGGADRLVVAPFARFGPNDGGRNHVDLREAYWLHQGNGWSLTLGIDKVFWGVTESRNLVDIVNQDDVLEDMGGGAKLGQPMVGLSFYGDLGALDIYVLPAFRPREFPAFGARLAGPVPIGAATYGAPEGAAHVDYALRWSQSFGDWDLGLTYFNGTGREPLMIPTGTGLVPRYDLIRQVGLDAQYTAGDWLWKLEAIGRSGQGPDFRAVTAGFERTISGIAGSGADLGVLVEWNYDGRDPRLAPATIYNNDLFVGARLTLNDIGDTSVLAGALIDRDNGARVVTIEGQRRFGENWVLGLQGRFFTAGTPGDPISVVAADDYVSLTLKRSF